ncbi:hypothetical protein FIBSPDRAFT_599462 [Athelia psychrophila]|uniref:Uncharacterized protein n=1 Tax=Athelia psychrophila TaxID=1759441 RepID=A0A166GS33_9AGAM|nr:hypothetical protein FIBSPDRAFT_599462 [Fibularhizoctonia sp. CBS 109695]
MWYADCGIPFLRVHPLHGVSGSGKSTLTHAVAFDIYTHPPSSSWIPDGALTTFTSRLRALHRTL